MNGKIKPALRKTLRGLALWLVLVLALPAGLSPAAHARQELASRAYAPAAFTKSSPTDLSTGQPPSVTLQWAASPDADSYQVCFDQDSNNTCGSGWVDVGNVTSVTRSTPLGNTTYSWQVSATNATGTTYADGASNVFWSLTTGAAPGNFTKSLPANGAMGQPTTLNLTWTASTGATSYEYCLDKDSNTTCESTWINVGNVLTIGVGPLDASSTYSWHVRAKNDAGFIFYSGNNNTAAFRTFTTVGPPAAFGKATPVDTATGQAVSLNLTWGASTDVTSYEYCYDNTPDNACGSWSSTAGTSAPIGGLSPGTTYYWQVRAVNSVSTTYADGADIAYWAFTTGLAPGGFNKTAPADGATDQLLNVSLTWGASAGAASYEYCIDTSTNNACDATWINVGTNLSVAPPGLAAGQTYSWHVRAINSFGTTDSNGSTNFWSFTTGSAPGNFNKTSPSNSATNQLTNLSLTWNASTGADSYEYCIATTLAGCTTFTSTGTNTSVAPPGLSAGTTYFWQVHAKNVYGTTDANAATVWSFSTGAAPSTFSRSSPANGSTGQALTLNLVWAASTGATGYEYCLDTSTALCNANWTPIGNVTSVQVGPLNASTQYFWHVRASNTFGTTYAGNAPGTFWSFTTGTPPATFSRSAPANGSTVLSPTPTLSWGSSSGATSYDYCLDTSTTLCNANWIPLGNVTSIQVGPLTASTTYFWHVRAVNSVGVTYAGNAPSTYWSFTTGLAPGAFNKTAPTDGATNQLPTLSLTWNASTGADSYEYCIDADTNNACNTGWINVGTNLSVVPPGLIAGRTYSWHVRAINAFGTTDSNGSTNFWGFTTGAAPGNFNKTSPSNGAANQLPTLSLVWNASAGAASYEYCIATTLAGCTTWTSTGTNTSVAPPGLSAGTTYFWQVHAVNLYGTTDANAATAWSFTTGAAPGLFSKSNPASNALNQSINPVLSWTLSSNSTRYEYCYDATANNQCDSGIWQNAGSLTSVSIGPLLEATQYSWHVRAVNDYGITYSGPLGATEANFRQFTTGTLPAAFSKSTPLNNAINRNLSLNLTWQTSTGATGYEYCLQTDTALCDPASLNWISTGTQTSAPISSLTPSTKYYWHVRASNSVGTTYSGGTISSFYNFTTGSPAAAFGKTSPLNLATNVATNPTLLSWAAATGASSYEYCIQTSAALCDPSSLNWVSVNTNTSASLTSLNAGTVYYWQVRAQNSFGTTYADGDNTAVWSFTTGFPPTAFNKNGPANGAINMSLTPTLQWGASTAVTKYRYCIDTVDNGLCDTAWVDAGLNTSVSIGPLTPGTTYYWHVRANNLYGITYSGPTPGSTAFWSFSTGPGPFGKIGPANTLTVAQSLSPTLSWNPSDSATDYEYCLATSSDTCTNWTSTGGAASVSVGSLTPSTIYYWQVRSLSALGTTYSNDSPTALWSFITAGVCPTISGWKGEYWRNEALNGPAVLCRSDADVNFDWQYAEPGPMIPADHFSTRWTRTVNFPTAGQYRFLVDHDDGARLYIDGVLRGNWWTTCCVVDKSVVYLGAGKHNLRLEFHETDGVAGVHLWWEQINAQFLSLGAQDGWVLESSETSGTGGSINASASQFYLGDDSANRQYRSILSFNTSGLPDNAVIVSATLKIKSAGVQGTSPFTTHGKLFGDVRLGGFNGSSALQTADFQAPSSQDAVLTISSTPSNGWYSGKMISGGLGYINRTGPTQIRLRFALDDNDDRAADYMKFYSGNYGTQAARPLLIIVYYLPP